MEHAVKEFTFIKKDGTEVKAITRPYNFKLEKVVKELIGSSNFEAYQKTNKLETELSTEKVKTYFPKLLYSDFDNIDLETQDFDLLLSVVAFFLNFRKNAAVRRLLSEKGTLVSTLANLKQDFALIQKDILGTTSFPDIQSS